MRYLFLFFAVLFTLNAPAQTRQGFKFQNGDLLFQDIDCGVCEAIEAVTPSWSNKKFSHTGLVYIKDSTVQVIEAIGKDVHMTPLDTFIKRQVDRYGQSKVVVGRLKPQYQALNDSAVRYALTQLGAPYDDVYTYGDNKYYCSELLYDAYQAANNGKPFFKLAPMTFKDPETNKYFPAWEGYYKDLGVKIPQGQPGCNPGTIANDPKVDIVAVFY